MPSHRRKVGSRTPPVLRLLRDRRLLLPPQITAAQALSSMHTGGCPREPCVLGLGFACVGRAVGRNLGPGPWVLKGWAILRPPAPPTASPAVRFEDPFQEVKGGVPCGLRGLCTQKACDHPV